MEISNRLLTTEMHFACAAVVCRSFTFHLALPNRSDFECFVLARRRRLRRSHKGNASSSITATRTHSREFACEQAAASAERKRCSTGGIKEDVSLKRNGRRAHTPFYAGSVRVFTFLSGFNVVSSGSLGGGGSGSGGFVFWAHAARLITIVFKCCTRPSRATLILASSSRFSTWHSILEPPLCTP